MLPIQQLGLELLVRKQKVWSKNFLRTIRSSNGFIFGEGFRHAPVLETGGPILLRHC